MSTDDDPGHAPRPVGNPAADKRRAQVMNLFLDPDEIDHAADCDCADCVDYRAYEARRKAGGK